MASIRISVDDGDLVKRLSKVDAGLADMRPMWANVSIRLYQLVSNHFRAQGPDWPPRAQSTRKRREKMGKDPDGPLLQLNGKLRGSITAPQGDGSIHDIGKLHLQVGSNIKYALIHNQGGTIKQKRRTLFGKPLKNPIDVEIKIPARRYLPTEEELAPHLVELGEDYLEDLVEGSNAG